MKSALYIALPLLLVGAGTSEAAPPPGSGAPFTAILDESGDARSATDSGKRLDRGSPFPAGATPTAPGGSDGDAAEEFIAQDPGQPFLQFSRSLDFRLTSDARGLGFRSGRDANEAEHLAYSGALRLEGAMVKDRIPTLTFRHLGRYASAGAESGETVRFFFTFPKWSGTTGAIGWGQDGSMTRPSLTFGSGGLNPYGNFFESGIAYRSTIGPISLKAGAGYSTGRSSNLFESDGPAIQLNNNFSAVHTGLEAGWNGFYLGFDYSFGGESETPRGGTDREMTSWGLSAELNYVAGPWQFGGHYWYARAPDLLSAAPTNSLLGIAPASTPGKAWAMNIKEIGVSYAIRPGLRLFGSAYEFDQAATQPLTSTRKSTGAVYLTGLSLHW